MSLGLTITLLTILLFGLFCLSALNSVFRRFQKKELKKVFLEIGNLFFYRSIHVTFFPKQEFETLFFVNTFTQNILRFLYVIFSVVALMQTHLLNLTTHLYAPDTSLSLEWPGGFLFLIGMFLLFFLIGDYLPRIFGINYPNLAIKMTAFPASLFLLTTFPITFIFLKMSKLFVHTLHYDHLKEPYAEAKQEIIDIIQESNVSAHLDAHDKKLLESVMAFKDRIAREVMVPRVDVFSLPQDTTIDEAAKILINEGYSRTPVYKNSLDNIIGVLMYKDILAKYLEWSQNNASNILKAPISTLLKPVVYTPETKKISHLLQEFRKKQLHLAIIVDEYGGTEGIVTIEDILEVIVGDISDEYDDDETLFIPLPQGGWVVDARMTILDIEEQLGIEIPQEGDYDTIGGYVFHETGMIPTKGYIIKKPLFELEILRSNDRRVEKVKIIPIAPTQESDEHMELTDKEK